MSKHPSHHNVEIPNDDRNGRAILRANPKKFRVVGVDTFSHEDWVYNEYDLLTEAIECANAHGATMNKTHVYDDQGRNHHSAGSY